MSEKDLSPSSQRDDTMIEKDPSPSSQTRLQASYRPWDQSEKLKTRKGGCWACRHCPKGSKIQASANGDPHALPAAPLPEANPETSWAPLGDQHSWIDTCGCVLCRDAKEDMAPISPQCIEPQAERLWDHFCGLWNGCDGPGAYQISQKSTKQWRHSPPWR